MLPHEKNNAFMRNNSASQPKNPFFSLILAK